MKWSGETLEFLPKLVKYILLERYFEFNRTEMVLLIAARASIDTSSMHRGLYEKTRRLEDKFVEPKYEIEEISKSKPIFTVPLNEVPPVNEGRNVHLECRLEPMGDPTMRVEWFHNGKPVTVGE